MRAIFFDVDGTLLDARGAGARALLAALAEVYGRPFGRNGVPFAGRTDSAIVRDLLVANGVPAGELELGLQDVFRTLPRQMRLEVSRTPSALCPGVLQLVTALGQQADLMTGLVTGNLRETAMVKLASAGLEPALFPVGAFGDESADRNALPAMALQRAAEWLGRPVTKAAVVGDTPADIACAHANGLCALAVATGPYSLDELATHRPEHLFADLSDLDAVLDALLGES